MTSLCTYEKYKKGNCADNEGVYVTGAEMKDIVKEHDNLKTDQMLSNIVMIVMGLILFILVVAMGWTRYYVKYYYCRTPEDLYQADENEVDENN